MYPTNSNIPLLNWISMPNNVGKMILLKISILLLLFQFCLAGDIDFKELKCLVCKRLVEEMEKEVDKVDPNKKVEVGTYRIDHKGNKKQKAVEYRRSEVYLTELMEKVCDKMEDFVRARSKTNGRLMVLPLFSEAGQMNPLLSQVDIIQDSDLNKSLKFYCEGILEEYEEGFVKAFSEASDNLDIRLCSEVAQLCGQTLDTAEDYQFEEHEEL